MKVGIAPADDVAYDRGHVIEPQAMAVDPPPDASERRDRRGLLDPDERAVDEAKQSPGAFRKPDLVTVEHVIELEQGGDDRAPSRMELDPAVRGEPFGTTDRAVTPQEDDGLAVAVEAEPTGAQHDWPGEWTGRHPALVSRAQRGCLSGRSHGCGARRRW